MPLGWGRGVALWLGDGGGGFGGGEWFLALGGGWGYEGGALGCWGDEFLVVGGCFGGGVIYFL